LYRAAARRKAVRRSRKRVLQQYTTAKNRLCACSARSFKKLDQLNAPMAGASGWPGDGGDAGNSFGLNAVVPQA